MAKKAAIIFIFVDSHTGDEKKAGLTAQLVNAIPALKPAYMNDSIVEFKYKTDIPSKVVSAYFKIVSSRISENKEIDFSTFTPHDWSSLFWLAFRLKDTDFFDERNNSFFPNFADLNSVILEMPEPAKLHYFGEYIGSCFSFECNCDRLRIKELKEDTKAWLDTLVDSQRQKYVATPISGVFKKVKKQLGHTLDLDDVMKEQWKTENEAALQSGTIFDWYELTMDIKIHLVHIQCELPKCTCERDFNEMWKKFCTTSPVIASFIWTNMKRDQLMRYAKTSDIQKDNIARRKKTFDELKTYIEFAKDKK